MSRVLLSTLPPTILGGVATIARMMAEHLRAQGHAVTVAHYAPLSVGADVNTGPFGTPSLRRYTEWDGFDCVAVGCRMPEREVAYYQPSPLWRGLIAEHDRHVAVGGNVLPAAPLAGAGVPHLIWAASDVTGDRIDRQRAMAPLRRLYDRWIVLPRLCALERRVLNGPGRVLSISRHTRDMLGRGDVLPIPVHGPDLSPPVTPPAPFTVGCAARHTDPRKQTRLLLDAVAAARAAGRPVTLRLAGPYDQALVNHAQGRGLTGAVTFLGELSRTDLIAFYRSLDVYVIASAQEGLNITGLEAASCAVPVVSTRCGGPEDYVRDGETGYLCDAFADDMAKKMLKIMDSRQDRSRLGAGAHRVAEAEYGKVAFAQALAGHWRDLWPGDEHG